MSGVVGERVKVVDAADLGQVGIRGKVVLESANTIVIEDEGRLKRVQKIGTVLQLEGKREIIRGDELSGRLEDRLERLTRR